jgi:tetratricopeptide (TPR) repeat protein
MLKSLFRELSSSLRRSAAEATAPADPVALDAADRRSFAAADLPKRRSLTEALAHQLSRGKSPVIDWVRLGDWRLQIKDLVEAEQAYRIALQDQPLHLAAQEGLGLTLLQLRRLDEAYLHLETAHRIDPMNAEVLTHWGLVDLELGNFGKAADKFQRAIERDPRSVHAWMNRALALLRLGQMESAIEHLQKAVVLRPDHTGALMNLALTLRQAERLDEALEVARRATAQPMAGARAWVIQADLLINQGDLTGSRAAVDRATQAEGELASVGVVRGKLEVACGQYESARSAYTACLARDSSHAEARHGLAQLELLLGEWSSGWDNFEARRRVVPSPVRGVPFEEWTGEDLKGRTLLVHSEQGLGDIILFAGCLPDLEALKAQVIVEVPPRLARLFQRSFPWARVVAHDSADAGWAWLDGLPPIERHIPMGSLPRLLRRDGRDFPLHRGYLCADPEATQEWRSRLSAASKPAIGLGWRGGLEVTNTRLRSLPLTGMLSGMDRQELILVSLQYGEVADELEAVRQNDGVLVHAGLSGFADLDDLASLAAACDGIVTVCSTLAHLAGALGVPSAVLVPRSPNWRYGATGPISPWYPSQTLFRQQEPGEWSGPLGQANEWIGRLKVDSGRGGVL